MIDPIGDGLRAAATRSLTAYPLVFAAGAITSIGPCAAPRYVAVAALAHAARRPWAVVAAFTTGLVGAYVALGAAAGAIASLMSASAAVYAAFAALLALGGIVTLARAGGAEAHAACAREAGAGRSHDDRRGGAGISGPFLLGASSVLVVSPCCTPVVAGIAGLTLTSGRTIDGIALLAAFACGHALPVVAAGALGARISRALRRIAATQAPAVVAGSLMLALAAYYGTLA